MSDVKWIKLMTDILNNEKIDAIRSMPEGDSIFVIWVGILCLAGKTNDNGFFYISPEIPFTEDLISRRFNEPINTVRLAFSVLQRFGMIDIINDIYHVSNWEKYQSTDRLAEIREYNRIAKQRSREKQKQLEVNDKSMTSQCGQDTERDIEEEKEIDKVKKKVIKKKYGAGENVLLTDDEYEKLQQEFPSDYDQRIDNLSYYLGSTGKRYKSHYMTILSWARKDDKKSLVPKKKEGRLDWVDNVRMDDLS